MRNNLRALLNRLFLITTGYLGLSCFCKGPDLTEKLINNSDIIFEGVLVKVDTIKPEDNNANGLEDDLLLAFKATKIFKGEKQETIYLKSSLSSCGFQMRYDRAKRNLGNIFLVYSNMIAGYFRSEEHTS